MREQGEFFFLVSCERQAEIEIESVLRCSAVRPTQPRTCLAIVIVGMGISVEFVGVHEGSER